MPLADRGHMSAGEAAAVAAAAGVGTLVLTHISDELDHETRGRGGAAALRRHGRDRDAEGAHWDDLRRRRVTRANRLARMARQRECWSTSSACAATWTSSSATTGRARAARAPRQRLHTRGSTSTTARRRAIERPLAVVKADLAGVDPDAVNLEVAAASSSSPATARCARPRAAPTSRSRSRPGPSAASRAGRRDRRRAGARHLRGRGAPRRAAGQGPGDAARRVPVERADR